MGSPRDAESLLRTIGNDDNNESESEHHGWQVEYLSGMKTERGATVHTNHPNARTYELVADRNEQTPTLVLFDDDDNAIAVYNGFSWVACRRIAKPGASI